MSNLSGMIRFTKDQKDLLIYSLICFDFQTLSEDDYDPNFPEINVYNPVDRDNLIDRIKADYNGDNCRNFTQFTKQEYYLAIDAITDQTFLDNRTIYERVTCYDVFHDLVSLKNSFYFA